MKTTFPAILIVLIALAASPHGAAAPSPRDPGSLLAEVESLEDLCFQHKKGGDFSAALGALEECVHTIFREAPAQAGAVRSELYARAEVYLHLAYRLGVRIAAIERVKALLEKAPGDAPLLKGVADYLLLRCHLRRGALAEATAIRDRLGFITDWQIIGPFENERGGGFATAYGPEKEIDLAATYDGKERPVSWRPLPPAAPTGLISLNNLFRPNDQCLAYALCFVDSDRDRKAALRTGSDEAIKVFVNGREVYALDARRQYHFDQDVIAIDLQRGRNALLLKICDRTRKWSFAARLTEPSGAPLKGVEIAASGDGYSHPEERAAGGPEKVDRGAIDIFEAGARDKKARHHFYLGILNSFNEYRGEESGDASRHLEAFLRSHPDHVAGRFLLALSRTRRTEMASELDENPWRLDIEKTLRLDPTHAECHLELARYYTYSLWIPNRARAHAEAALRINPEFLEARLLLIRILDFMQFGPLSRSLLDRCAKDFDGALASPGLLSSLGALAREEGRIDDARKLYRRALKADHLSWSAREALYEIARDEGDVDTMIGLLDEEYALYPSRTSLLTRKADLFLGEEAYADALGLLERAKTIAPDNDALFKALGKAYDLAGKRPEAIAAWERALELNPKAASLQRHLEYLKESAAPFEDAFKVDVPALIAAHPAPKNEENHPHEYLLRHDVYKVNPDGTSSRYHHEVVRILSDNGASAFDFFATFYALGEEKTRIKTARVFHADGTIEESRIDNTVRRDMVRNGQAPAFVDLPALRPGDVVDIEFRTDQLRQSIFGNYFGLKHYFNDGDLEAVRDARLALLLPPDVDYRFNERFVDVAREERVNADGLRVLSWQIDGIEKFVSEPHMPGRAEFAPCVEVSTFENWNDLAAWWWRLIDNQCDINAAMQAKVEELTAGCATRRDKIRAIYNFVVSHIRYNDTWEFGIHGFKPYRASAIFNNRFGDCKDKAILIRTLLAEIGVRAFPVMIRLDGTRTREDLTLPLINHFNHAIAWVAGEGDEAGFFLDGTAQFHPMEALPDADRGATVVIVDAVGCTIERIPYDRGDKNMSFTSNEVALSADGSAVIAVESRAIGTNEAGVRSQFLNPGKRTSQFKDRYGSVFGEIDVGRIAFSDVEDLNEPVSYSLEVRAADILIESGSGYQLRSVFFPFQLGQVVSLETREWDLLLGAPSGSQSRIVYTLPEGFVAETLPDDVKIESPYCTFSLDYTNAEGAVIIERTLLLEAPRVPVEDYPLFRDICREIEKAEEGLIHIRKA